MKYLEGYFNFSLGDNTKNQEGEEGRNSPFSLIKSCIILHC